MRRFEYKGKQYNLTERDYKKLLAKLDTSKAYLDGDEYRIDNACICPGGSVRGCSICPLGSNFHCLKLLSVAAGRRMPRDMEFFINYIAWPKHSKTAVKYLDVARQKILELPRVK